MKTITLISLTLLVTTTSVGAQAAPLKLDIAKTAEATVSKKSKPKKAKKIKKKKYGLSGQFTLQTDLEDQDSVFNASIKWKPKPKSFYYLKASAKQKLSSGDDKFTYGWNLGYDDYHPGTWSPQLNHWGGIKPGEGLDIDNAVASLAYKIKSKFLKKHRLSSTVTVSKKIDSDADFKLSTSLQWSPKQYWYIKAILVNNLNTGEPVWNYVAGYDDWHPNTWSMEYSNYDQNELNELNFKKNGKFAISYKWAF